MFLTGNIFLPIDLGDFPDIAPKIWFRAPGSRNKVAKIHSRPTKDDE